MLTTAKILVHSVDKFQQELITFELYYPRKIHGEVMTYRMFSRNTASSRAIPFAKNLADIDKNLYMPFDVRVNMPGMQGLSRLDEDSLYWFQSYHQNLWDETKRVTEIMSDLKPHKQHINRYLEPFQYIRVILTSCRSGIEHLIMQRLHPMADPEFYLLAQKISEELENSIPILLKEGQYHLPFILPQDRIVLGAGDLIKVSVARCARVSYHNHTTDTVDYEKDFDLYKRLRTENPPHMSPFEHVAICTNKKAQRYFDVNGDWITKNVFYNFDGWKSIRFLIEQENFTV